MTAHIVDVAKGLNLVLKPEQIDAILSVLQGKHSRVLFPTGFDKSICFQILPLLIPGSFVIVITPYLALAADQVTSCNRHGIPATFFGSTAPGKQQDNMRGLVLGQFLIGVRSFLASTATFSGAFSPSANFSHRVHDSGICDVDVQKLYQGPSRRRRPLRRCASC
ncbi:hypothetical protein AMAG_14557 [Allomyces macrogynus ATCC 38327]|uniref:DNA 3'-5' helicase n=1 Tax=Allomyces macrogynus (strain ATCC 38327) TaxID=578462 RepID=A0A0L0T6Q2_ALLM3|nr:hypothetical protein AMAG_14557 [Allomyces macrogynus ATCC 38327]|eukprot:KNE70425.1 hypothetical protein AMAG_14557 [Allomyces macrogynus ATCC 38327]